MTPTELADRIEHATSPPGGTWGDYVRLDYDCWRMVIAALRSIEADKTAIALLRAWVAGCGDERFATKEQVKALIDASGDLLASQSDKQQP